MEFVVTVISTVALVITYPRSACQGAIQGTLTHPSLGEQWGELVPCVPAEARNQDFWRRLGSYRPRVHLHCQSPVVLGVFSATWKAACRWNPKKKNSCVTLLNRLVALLATTKAITLF